MENSALIDEEMNEDEENELLRSDDDEMTETDNADDSKEASDSSDDEDEEQKQIKAYIDTLQVISESKFSYEAYVQLTEIAQTLCDLEKIRESFELFSLSFPLSPELWKKYITVEKSIVSSSEEKNKIIDLYKRALSDYFSSQTATDFANFLLEEPSKEHESIWSELIETYGYHCMHGRDFFNLYRKYIKQAGFANEESQMFLDSFIKELRIPLYNMEDSYIELKVYIQKNDIKTDWDTIEADYNDAKAHLQKILPYEKQLSDLNPNYHQERALLYKDYLRDGDKFLDEEVLQIIYERMITDCCLNPTCWLDYISYLEIRDKFEKPKGLPNRRIFNQSVLDLSLRSIRNCTWNENMYIKRMQLMEKMERSVSDVQEVLEMGLSVGFHTPESSVSLWIEYLSYLRRNTKYRDAEECEILRKNFDLCWNTLGKQWGVLADCNCEILQFWGRLEYGFLDNPLKGKDLWLTAMSSADNSVKSGLWMEFIQLEKAVNWESTRKLFRKALTAQGLDNPYVISSAWIRFERSYGNLKTLLSAQEEIEKILLDISVQNQKLYDQQNKSKGKKRKSDETDDENKSKSPSKKVKAPAPPPPQAQQDKNEVDMSKDHLRIFVSNLDYNITEEELRDHLPELTISNVNLIMSANGRGRGFGYIELVSEDQVEKAISFDRRMIKGRPAYISSVLRDKEKREAFKYSVEIEPRKLFVKGLPHEATKDEITDLFAKYGKVVDVRVVVHKSGKSKGIAYVEYETDQEASKAVMKLDQTEYKEHTLTVAISAPPPKSTKKDSLNIEKLLAGRAKRKPIAKSEQKPRMNLIPNVVRQQMKGPPPPGFPGNSNNSMPPPAAPAPVPKSNDDFRKLLQK